MVHSGEEEFIRFTVNNFNKKIKDILNKINVSLEQKTQQELQYIKKEIENMSKNFNFNPTYLSVLNEIDNADADLINSLYEIFNDFMFCKSIIKEKEGNYNNLSNEYLSFIKEANNVLDSIIKDIINLYKKDSKDKNIFLLQKIKNEIENMKKTLNSNIYIPSYPRIILDAWDFNKDIIDDLIQLNYQYLKLK